MLEENSIRELGGIIQKNKEAGRWYEQAAEQAKSGGLSDYFCQKTAERLAFNQDLRRAICAHFRNFEPDTPDSESAEAWMDAKYLSSSCGDEALLDASIRGDRAALQEYDRVMAEELPPDVRALLMTQRSVIRFNMDLNARLEDLDDDDLPETLFRGGSTIPNLE